MKNFNLFFVVCYCLVQLPFSRLPVESTVQTNPLKGLVIPGNQSGELALRGFQADEVAASPPFTPRLEGAHPVLCVKSNAFRSSTPFRICMHYSFVYSRPGVVRAVLTTHS